MSVKSGQQNRCLQNFQKSFLLAISYREFEDYRGSSVDLDEATHNDCLLESTMFSRPGVIYFSLYKCIARAIALPSVLALSVTLAVAFAVVGLAKMVVFC